MIRQGLRNAGWPLEIRHFLRLSFSPISHQADRPSSVDTSCQVFCSSISHYPTTQAKTEEGRIPLHSVVKYPAVRRLQDNRHPPLSSVFFPTWSIKRHAFAVRLPNQPSLLSQHLSTAGSLSVHDRPYDPSLSYHRSFHHKGHPSHQTPAVNLHVSRVVGACLLSISLLQMPVPVPRVSRPLSHPVVKKNNCGDGQANPFQNFTRTLPVSPTGPPPSFGTREEWIKSLPSWRRTKPRRIWEDDARLFERRAEQCFNRGLTAADNAPVIKGAHAEACIPPLYTLLQAPAIQYPADLPQGSDGDADDEMSSDYSTMDQGHLDNESQWSASSPIDDDMDVEHQSQVYGTEVSPGTLMSDFATFDERVYERGAFTPVFEDESPGTASCQDIGSSPLEPVTPFGEFVDRAVAAAPYSNAFSSGDLVQDCNYPEKGRNLECYQVPTVYQPLQEHFQESAPAPEVVTPSATAGYKVLAEPLSEWVASYVWKVCTTGLSLPSKFSRAS